MSARRSILAALLVIPLAPAAHAAAEPAAQQLLARAKAASGGAAWDAILTTHSHSAIATGGLEGSGESWEDTRRGHFLDRFELGPIQGANGFDGESVWEQDTSGQVRINQGADGREAAMNDGYRRALAYWYPERWPAQEVAAGATEEGGRHFAVVRLTPRGGRPFDLWIDTASWLVDRVVEKGAQDTRTWLLSDYREVAGVKVPFSTRSTNGETRYDQLIRLTAIEFNATVEAARFAPPPPPPPDFRIAGGRTSVTVPFELLNNHMYVQVKLDGKGPFRLLCDTGGANIVTPQLARQLGLKAEGALQGRGVGERSQDVGLVKIGVLEVGDASLADQVFMVFDLGKLGEAEGLHEDGLIGYEVFKRFVVTVNYEKSELTLTEPAAFVYQGTGTVVPFVFSDSIPQVDGSIDGIPGKFDIDTGSRASLDLMAAFVEAHDLRTRYAPKVEAVTGWGVGGAARSQVTRAKLLQLGEVRIENPVTMLTLQTKGAFTDRYVAGNVGAGVLKRFTIVFDYPKQRLIFEPNALAAQPDTFDRAGLWMNLAGAAFEVIDVVAGGPAATAGIRAGDRVLAIDGAAPDRLSLAEARQRLRTAAPGTRLRFLVESGGTTTERVVELRDLV